MERAIARASQAYKANEIALDDGGHLATTAEEPSVHGPTPDAPAAHVEASPKSARNLHHVKSAKNLRTAAAVTVNLRDCGSISRILRQGRMFRSSQVMRYVSKRDAHPRTPPQLCCHHTLLILQCGRDRQTGH